MIKINGVPFERNPLIGLPNEPGYAVRYKYNYEVLMQRAVKEGPEYQDSMLRKLILNDLWFLTYFVVKPFTPGNHQSFNHPFLVRACREVEEGPRDKTLDIWARFHFKSSIITIAETIQDALKAPEEAIGLFAFKAAIARQKYLFSIKTVLETERILYDCFRDIVWEKADKEAPMWSLEGGLVLKRRSNRGEPTISGHGLIEGVPTSMHFERRKYDDITTEDMADSPGVMEDVKIKFDSSQNLRTEGGSHRVIGTIYHYSDPLTYVRDKKDINGKPKYLQRLKPATDNGLANGRPVLISQETLDDLKTDRTFNCQQLLNPIPEGDQKLNPEYLHEIERQFLPKNLFKFLLVDPAGDDRTNKTRDGDAWGIMLLGIEPGTDETGAWKRYILDAFVDKLEESEAVEVISRMYLNGGVVHKFGYEKFSNFTPAVAMHVIEALKKRGRYVSEENKSFVWLRPAGRNKAYFIKNSLQWPLNNGKWFISKGVPAAYRDRIKQELHQFPFWHDDALNVMAYLDDIVKDETFKFQAIRSEPIKMMELGIV